MQVDERNVRHEDSLLHSGDLASLPFPSLCERLFQKLKPRRFFSFQLIRVNHLSLSRDTISFPCLLSFRRFIGRLLDSTIISGTLSIWSVLEQIIVTFL
jgi:hypothetical protein